VSWTLVVRDDSLYSAPDSPYGEQRMDVELDAGGDVAGLWFGGERLSDTHIRRIAAYGAGFHPFGRPTPAELERYSRFDAVIAPLEIALAAERPAPPGDPLASFALALLNAKEFIYLR
jgi:hypothetical protein